MRLHETIGDVQRRAFALQARDPIRIAAIDGKIVDCDGDVDVHVVVLSDGVAGPLAVHLRHLRHADQRMGGIVTQNIRAPIIS